MDAIITISPAPNSSSRIVVEQSSRSKITTVRTWLTVKMMAEDFVAMTKSTRAYLAIFPI